MLKSPPIIGSLVHLQSGGREGTATDGSLPAKNENQRRRAALGVRSTISVFW